MFDGLWAIMIIALVFSNKKIDDNHINYLDEYKKYGDDE